jgi:Ca2+-binding RTX toxin-like protein
MAVVRLSLGGVLAPSDVLNPFSFLEEMAALNHIAAVRGLLRLNNGEDQTGLAVLQGSGLGIVIEPGDVSVTGRITSMTYGMRGGTFMEVSGLNISAAALFAAFSADDIRAARDLVLRGDDRIFGSAGRESLGGSDGDDTIFGFGNGDLLIGDKGNDLIKGGTGRDELSGDQGRDRLFGEASDDALSGGDGNDRLFGGAGRDLLYGGNGIDLIYGGDGGDTFFIDAGKDVLTGGAGRDTFMFIKFSAPGQENRITDFQHGVDKIHLYTTLDPQFPPGDLAPGAFRRGAVAQDADDRIIYNPANGKLFLDADGDAAGQAVLIAFLKPGIALNADDFRIIEVI